MIKRGIHLFAQSIQRLLNCFRRFFNYDLSTSRKRSPLQQDTQIANCRETDESPMSSKQDFADLKFKVECSQMVLAKGGGNPLVLRGPGEIWQDEEGGLQYKVFIDQAGYRGLRAYVVRPGVIGQLIPADDYFTLQAQEHCLPIWNAAQILPSPRGGPIEGLANGFINELTQTSAIPANPDFDHVEICFKGKLNFPCNQGTQTVTRIAGQDRRFSNSFDVAFAEDGNYRFEIRHESNHTVASLRLPAGELTAATASRIREALQFVLGEQLAVMVIETSCGGQRTTRFTSPDRGHGKMSPPLLFQNRLDEGGHVWRMFCNYFRRVHEGNSPEWHPISNHIGRVIESTAASLETEILALGVAVEGLAGECFPDLAPVSPDFLTDLNAIQFALQGLELRGQTMDRVGGSLNSMRSPRNSDILRAFIAANRLPRGLYNSWGSLRHASAHGGGAGGRDIETILRLKSEVLSLMYSIVFAAINYSGQRTDYSLTGWPTQAWPIPQPPQPVA